MFRKNTAPLEVPTEDMPRATGNESTQEVYMTLEEVDGKLFLDQTGPFPRTSNRGKKICGCVLCV